MLNFVGRRWRGVLHTHLGKVVVIVRVVRVRVRARGTVVRAVVIVIAAATSGARGGRRRYDDDDGGAIAIARPDDWSRREQEQGATRALSGRLRGRDGGFGRCDPRVGGGL